MGVYSSKSRCTRAESLILSYGRLPVSKGTESAWTKEYSPIDQSPGVGSHPHDGLVLESKSQFFSVNFGVYDSESDLNDQEGDEDIASDWGLLEDLTRLN